MAEATVSRYESLDVLKGFIIIVVVCGHLMVTSTGSESDRALPIAMQIMYLGLMSFFIISGYFYRPGRGFVENIKRRGTQLFVALVICAVVLPVITYVWLAILGQSSDPSDIVDAILKALYLSDLFMPMGPTDSYIACSTCVGYYFLWAMMGGFLIFYGLADRIMNDWRKFIVTIAVLLVAYMLFVEFWPVRLPFYFQIAPLAALFMFAGALLAKYRFVEKVEVFAWRSLSYWLPCIICLVAGVVLCVIFPPGIKFDWAIFGDYGGLSVIPFMIASLLMFVVFVYVAKLVAKLPLLPKLLNLSGQHTMGLLLYHGFVATMILAPFYVIPTTSWFPVMGLTNRIVTAVAVIVICLVICVYGPKVIEKVRGRCSADKDKTGEGL